MLVSHLYIPSPSPWCAALLHGFRTARRPKIIPTSPPPPNTPTERLCPFVHSPCAMCFWFPLLVVCGNFKILRWFLLQKKECEGGIFFISLVFPSFFLFLSSFVLRTAACVVLPLQQNRQKKQSKKQAHREKSSSLSFCSPSPVKVNQRSCRRSAAQGRMTSLFQYCTRDGHLLCARGTLQNPATAMNTICLLSPFLHMRSSAKQATLLSAKCVHRTYRETTDIGMRIASPFPLACAVCVILRFLPFHAPQPHAGTTRSCRPTLPRAC